MTYRLLYLFLLFATAFLDLKAQPGTWKPLGPNNGMVSNPWGWDRKPELTVDTAGNPIVIFAEGLNKLMRVKKYVDSTWQEIGTPDSSMRGFYPEIFVTRKDSLYIAYYKLAGSNQSLVIRKYNGTNWIPVGDSIPLINIPMYHISLALDSNDKIYCAVGNNSSGPGYNYTNVYTFNGSSWETVGNTAFMAQSSVISIAIGPDNQLYAGYNIGVLDTSYVKKWDGTSWQPVGTALHRSIVNLAFGPDGTLFILYDWGRIVAKLDSNGQWQNLGNYLILADLAEEMAIDPFNNPAYPVIMYSNYSLGCLGTSIMHWFGNSWGTMGNPCGVKPPSIAGISRVQIAFGKGKTYIAFDDDDINDKIYVMYFDTTSPPINYVAPVSGSYQSLTVSPNPLSGPVLQLQVAQLPAGSYDVLCLNTLGQVVHQQSLSHQPGQDAQVRFVTPLPPGVYFLRLSGSGDTYTARVVVE